LSQPIGAAFGEKGRRFDPAGDSVVISNQGQHMNGFLVVFRNLMDDFPVSLHATKEEALRRLEEIAENHLPELQRMNGIVGVEASTPISIAIAEYVNGELASFEVEWDFD
jgi:hypothetical protein